jgi:hypothetical protein
MRAVSRAWFPVLFFTAASLSLAQSRETDDSWWTRNYHFAGPPAPDERLAESQSVAQLREVQNTILSIMRKADFAWDFQTALFAAAEAAANARLLGAITGEIKLPAPPPRTPQDPPPANPAKYFVALNDGTVQPATAVWTDRLMLHYLTPAGTHGQVRLDLVDWKRSLGLQPPTAIGSTEPAPK